MYSHFRPERFIRYGDNTRTAKAMRITGRNRWEILLKYYPPWDGRPLKKKVERRREGIVEVFQMVGDPRKLQDIPEDVRAILKFVCPEVFLQDA